jgi:hypothetical protein
VFKGHALRARWRNRAHASGTIGASAIDEHLGGEMVDEELARIRVAIEEAEASWQVGRTPFTDMPAERRRLHLGFNPGPGDPTLAEREQLSRQLTSSDLATELPPGVTDLPVIKDWRDVDGRSFVTRPKFQGACGSCVAFGVVGAIESAARIGVNDPDLLRALGGTELHRRHPVRRLVAGARARCLPHGSG